MRFSGVAVASVLGLAAIACGGDDAPSSGQGGAGGGAGSGGCADPVTGDVLATNQTNLGYLALDATHLYWRFGSSAPGARDGGVRRIALASGCVDEVMTDLTGGGPLAVSADAVYAIDSEAGAIVTVPLSGGPLATLQSGVTFAYDLVADASALYYATGPGGDVLRVPLDGGSVVTLATGQKTPLGVAVDDTHVYFANDGNEGDPPYADGSFARVPKSGGAVEMLESPVTGGQDVAVAGGTAFFLQFGFPPTGVPGAVWRLDLPGTQPRIVASGLGPSIIIETDGTNAYVAGNLSATEGGLVRFSADGAPTVLASTRPSPSGIAVDSKYVYYADAANGEVRRLAK